MVALSSENELVFMAAMLEFRRRLAAAEGEAAYSRLTLTVETERGKAKDRFHVSKNDDVRAVPACNGTGVV